MKKLIVMDLVRICGSDLTSGTSDEKCECMGYDNNSAPFFNSILFRDEVFWTFSVSHTLPFNACRTHLCSLSLEIAREWQLCYLS